MYPLSSRRAHSAALGCTSSSSGLSRYRCARQKAKHLVVDRYRNSLRYVMGWLVVSKRLLVRFKYGNSGTVWGFVRRSKRVVHWFCIRRSHLHDRLADKRVIGSLLLMDIEVESSTRRHRLEERS